MVWIGLIGGIIIGALIGELQGAIVLGFVGWLVGLIVKSGRESKNKPLDLNTGARYVPGTGQGPAGLEGRA